MSENEDSAAGASDDEVSEIQEITFEEDETSDNSRLMKTDPGAESDPRGTCSSGGEEPETGASPAGTKSPLLGTSPGDRRSSLLGTSPGDRKSPLLGASPVLTGKRKRKEVDYNETRKRKLDGSPVRRSSRKLGGESSLGTGKNVKCSICRQKLSRVKRTAGYSGTSEEAAVAEPRVNLNQEGEGEGEGEALQYKLADFSVFCSASHLVQLFTDNLQPASISLYFSGVVLPIWHDRDGEGLEEGVAVSKSGRITGWSNEISDGPVHNIMLTTSVGGREVTYTLTRPAQEYSGIYKNVHKMCYAANIVIYRLIRAFHENHDIEYGELVDYCTNAGSPEYYGELLGPVDEEYIQWKSLFLASQIFAYENGGDDDEILTIIGSEAVQHIVNIAGYVKKGGRRDRGEGRDRTVPEYQTLAETTPLVRDLFETIFRDQMRLDRSETDPSYRSCYSCQACRREECGRCDQCQQMTKFGGKQQDDSLVCERRVCLNNRTIVTVPDELQDPDKQSFCEWDDEGYELMCGGIMVNIYQSARFLMPDAIQSERIDQGMFIAFSSDIQQDQGIPLQVGRVLFFKVFHSKYKDRELEIAHVQMFASPTETVLGRASNPREYFLMDACEEVPIPCIKRILKIDHRPVSSVDQWREEGGRQGEEVADRSLFWRQQYCSRTGRFFTPPSTAIPGHQEDCYICQEKSKQNSRAVLTIQGDTLVWGEFILKKGQFCFLKDHAAEELRFTTCKPAPVTLSRTFHREEETRNELDPQTWDPVIVAQLEAVQSSTASVLLRICYRPQNTKTPYKETRGENLCKLYYTSDIQSMPVGILEEYLIVDGQPKVVYCSPQLEHMMVDWTERDRDRFYVMQYYQKDKNTYRDLTKNEIRMSCLEVFSPDSPDDKERVSSVRPLRTMDIFSGAGGLSKGLEESGVAKVLWGIEHWEPAAKAFELNHSDAQMFLLDCNALLEKIMKNCDSSLPKKGEVEMLVGGPPCQGFSIMNLFRNSESSKLKNSCVATFLSYCDYYRPRFFILENVRDLVVNEKGLTLKLILAALVRMGYQTAFSVMTAGHFGVAQKRHRLVVVGAGPGEILPHFPHPEYTHPGRFFTKVKVDGNYYQTMTSSRCGANRRTMTVWDAISDLPPIKSGQHNEELAYTSPPLSHVQRAYFRSQSGARLRDHVTREANWKDQERFNRIPTTPFSDWRDLPNIALSLGDGREIVKLEYPYLITGQKERKGVCSCSTSHPKNKVVCDEDDKQADTLIPWFLPHTQHKRGDKWRGVYGRLSWNTVFRTTLTNPHPAATQGQVLHPEQPRVCSVREFARSQGFRDSFIFYGETQEKYRQIGNAVPPPLGRALGQEVWKSLAQTSRPISPA